ncbi:MAG: hypothetical protein WC703_07600 [Candidatus Neomarinimicrobiota bacterium]
MRKRLTLYIGIAMLIGISSAQPSTSAGQPIDLYVLSFDNVESDSEIGWLKDGFIDFISNHFLIGNEVVVHRTEKMDAVLKQVREKTQKPGKKYYVLTGSFHRKGGHFIVDLELFDITTWQKINSRQIDQETVDIARIIEDVNKALDEMLFPDRKKTAVGSLMIPINGSVSARNDSIRIASHSALEQKFSAVSQTTLNIQKALDNFGKTQRNDPQTPGVTENISATRGVFEYQVKEHLTQSSTFLELLDKIVHDPYQIEIEPPLFQRISGKEDRVEMSFSVTFKPKRELIREMFVTLPVSSIFESQDFSEFWFKGDKFIIDEKTIQRIAMGEFRMFPVISFVSEKGKVEHIIIDVPATSGFEPESVTYDVQHRFTPLLNVLGSSWDVRVFLLKRDITVDYSVELPIKTLGELTTISVRMMSEGEISAYLKDIQ